MKTLKELQQHFQIALLQGASTSCVDFIASSYPQERFEIYRQTLFENLRNALAITYPAIWILLGEECANSVAYRFIKQTHYLPQTGALDDWGADFPDFLNTIDEFKTLAYLKDVAMVEWFKHQSYCALDAMPLELQVLQDFSEDELNELRFEVHPSCFLWLSHYPLQNIFHIIENPDAQSINLQEQDTFVLVHKHQYQVEIYWLTQPQFLFLNTLKQGNTLNQAYENALMIDEGFDLSHMVYLMFDKGLIIGFR